MKSKLPIIIKREFLAKVKNKSFIIMTFLSPIIMIAMILLIVFLNKANQENLKKVAWVDESNYFSDQNFKSNDQIAFFNMSKLGFDETEQKVKEGDFDGVLLIPKVSDINQLKQTIKYISEETPGVLFVSNLESVVDIRLQELKLNALGISMETFKKTSIHSNIHLENFSGKQTSKMDNNVKIFFGLGAGYLLMMFIIIYGNSVLRSVIEEKTSRIIEIIISSIKPFELMLGKILGAASAGILQFFIWGILLMTFITIGGIAFGVSGGEMIEAKTHGMVDLQNSNHEFALILASIQNLPIIKMFVLFIVYFIGGYLLYSSLYAAVGAAVDSETDSQQFMLPIIMPLMIGVYVGISVVISDPHGPISVIFSMIPFTSPVVMLMRVPFGVTWWELVISISLLIGTFLVTVYLAAKIYRIGILMYGKKA